MADIWSVPVGEVLLWAAAEVPACEALVLPEVRRTYGELADGAIATAQSLMALGIQPGDHVGVLMPNSVELVEAIFGTALLGAVIVPLNIRYVGDELAHTIVDADLSFLLTVAPRPTDTVDLTKRLADALPNLTSQTNADFLQVPEAPRLRQVAVIGGDDVSLPGSLSDSDFRRAAKHCPRTKVLERAARVPARRPFILIYSSGSTARPKGCVLTHEAVMRNWRAFGERCGTVGSDRVWNPLPMFHLGGVGVLIMTCLWRATLVTMRHFEPTAGLAQISQERPTLLCPGFPPVAMGLLRHPNFSPELTRHARMTFCVGPAETLRTVAELAPDRPLVTIYGLTEAGSVVTATSVGDPAEVQFGTNGYPISSAEVRIVPLEGISAQHDRDAVGEIQFRSATAFEGYFGDDELTKLTVQSDGWIRTGDLGFIRPDGRLCFVGRAKETLKVGGENVAVAEIEALLTTHRDVILSAVVPRADAKYGEVPVAFVELVEDAAVTPDELIGFCRSRIASFKVPREVRVITDWPMSQTKIQKQVLAGIVRDEQAIEQ